MPSTTKVADNISTILTLMLVASRNGNAIKVPRCIYCAFKDHQEQSRLLRLQRAAFHTSVKRCLPRPSLWAGSFERDYQDSQDSRRKRFKQKHDGNLHVRRNAQRPGHLSFSHKGGNHDSQSRPNLLGLSQHNDRAGSFLGPTFSLDDNGKRRGKLGRLKGLMVGVRSKEASKRLRGLADFDAVLRSQLDVLRDHVRKSAVLDDLAKEMGQTRDQIFESAWARMSMALQTSRYEKKRPFGRPTTGLGRLYDDAQTEYMAKGLDALKSRLQFTFYDLLLGSRYQADNIARQKAIADIRFPVEMYPKTRQRPRTFHLHVGPTNSGKTYQALKRLEQAGNGAYAGPLRLLAHEVYGRMNAKGIPTALITGEEIRLPTVEGNESDAWQIRACTVEMLPTSTEMDVCVIDEIQMIAHEERGHSWTSAIMGVNAAEVHLCGEARAVPLIQELCASMGEKLIIHRYERLSPLKMASSSLNGDLRQLRKGDCVVSFSVVGIYALRKQIEEKTGRKVAIVYGSLPPETRNQQAQLFNDPDNDYDILVASDAVGMGLNLAIKRMIFESVIRFNGERLATLDVASIKQIAGRAGRYRTAVQAANEAESAQPVSIAKGDMPARASDETSDDAETNGLVTTMEEEDFDVVAAALGADPPPLKSAGLDPPVRIFEQLSTYYPPETPFSYLLLKVHELCSLNKRFHLCSKRDKLEVADLIDHVKGLSIADRYQFLNVPIGGRSEKNTWGKLMPKLASIIADRSDGHIAHIKEIPLETLDLPRAANREFLSKLENLHKSIVSYLWLSYRFPGVFTTQKLAFHAKRLVEDAIAGALDAMSFADRRKQVQIMRAAQLAQEEELRLNQSESIEAEEGYEAPTQPEPIDLADEISQGELALEENVELAAASPA